MKMIALDSSTMNATGYDAALKKLRIVFSKNEVYDYKNVPPKVFEGLLQAKSKGTFFNLHIKEKFAYEKI